MPIEHRPKTHMSEQEKSPAVLGLKKDEIRKLVKSHTPKGQDPVVWYTLVRNKMGVDKSGQYRPAEDIIQFIYVCYRTGLDPIVGQIYAVYRWDSMLGKEKMTIQAGIDGMRLVAQRTGDYAGQDDVKFTPEDESQPHPLKATVTVYKFIQKQKVSFTASARWNEYAQKNNKGIYMGMWSSNRMPYNQLGKCAEALALRKGFPNELAGIYAPEEMSQAVILADLPTPEKFENKDKVEVLHGAPENAQISNPPAPAIPGEAPIVGNEEAAKIEKPKETTTVAPNIGAMREQLKKGKGVKNNMNPDEPKTDVETPASPVSDSRTPEGTQNPAEQAPSTQTPPANDGGEQEEQKPSDA